MTGNEKYVKCSQTLIIGDDLQRHEEEVFANRNKMGVPFQYAGSRLRPWRW